LILGRLVRLQGGRLADDSKTQKILLQTGVAFENTKTPPSNLMATMASSAICTRAKESGSFLTRTTAFKKLTKWAFSVCDSDKTGQLGKSELFAGLLLVHVNLAKYAGAAACYPPSREVVEQLFEASDDDNSGYIDEEEFTSIVVICCGQIFSRMLVYYSVFAVMAPYLAGNIVSNIDSFVLGSELLKPGLLPKPVIDTALYIMEPAVGLVFFFLLIPLLFNVIDSFSKTAAEKTVIGPKSSGREVEEKKSD
jgi:hypothetical protein